MGVDKYSHSLTPCMEQLWDVIYINSFGGLLKDVHILTLWICEAMWQSGIKIVDVIKVANQLTLK